MDDKDGISTPNTHSTFALVPVPDKRPPARRARKSCKERPDAFTAAKQNKFFEHLAETCNISAAARHAGVSLNTIWVWRRTKADFAHRFDIVRADAYANLEMHLLALALHGVKAEQWQEAGEDGALLTKVRRDDPGHGRSLQHKHEQAALAVDSQSAAERAPRETLDEMIDRLSQRLSEIEAEEAGEHGAQR